MNLNLTDIVNRLKSENEDYIDFKSLTNAIEQSPTNISKDDILDFISKDRSFQVHLTQNIVAQIISSIVGGIRAKNGIDIGCGTGNILYHLKNQIENLTGIEIDENLAAIARYLNPQRNIFTADVINYDFKVHYELVVGHVPIGSRVEYHGKKITQEEAFVRKALELCSDNGNVIMVVPHALLIVLTYRTLRNEFSPFLKLVLLLPKEKNTFFRSAILWFTKSKVTTTQIGVIDGEYDAQKGYKGYIKKELPNSSINDRWDPEFFFLQDKDLYKQLAAVETKPLHELAQFLRGKVIQSTDLKESGDYIYLKPSDWNNDVIDTSKPKKYVNKNQLKDTDQKYIALPGDIIFCKLFDDVKFYVHKKGDFPCIVSAHLTIIRSVDDDYILSYLQTEDGKKVFSEQVSDLSSGMIMPHLSIENLRNIRIPIIPIGELNQLGNKSIDQATASQLEGMIESLKEYKDQVESLRIENDELKAFRNFFEDRFNRLESQLVVVNQKLDSLLEQIKELSLDFKRIKELPRDEEERVFKLCQSIDQKLETIYKEQTRTIENYIEEIKRWLDLWDTLDVESQKFLPIAEFIFDELNRIPEADYSPFVVQYCRSLENEILKKIFESYHTLGLKDVDIIELTQGELTHPKTGKFANMVRKNKMTYTLGDMNFIISLLKTGGNTLKESKLLQHFKDFIVKYFELEILETLFINDLGRITNDFRNKAAHPHVITIDSAKECQQLLRKNLNFFLESKKRNNL